MSHSDGLLGEVETLRRLRRHRADRAERALREARRAQQALLANIRQAEAALSRSGVMRLNEAPSCSVSTRARY